MGLFGRKNTEKEDQKNLKQIREVMDAFKLPYDEAVRTMRLSKDQKQRYRDLIGKK